MVEILKQGPKRLDKFLFNDLQFHLHRRDQVDVLRRSLERSSVTYHGQRIRSLGTRSDLAPEEGMSVYLQCLLLSMPLPSKSSRKRLAMVLVGSFRRVLTELLSRR